MNLHTYFAGKTGPTTPEGIGSQLAGTVHYFVHFLHFNPSQATNICYIYASIPFKRLHATLEKRHEIKTNHVND